MQLLNVLNEHVELLSLLWLFPVTFLFHDFEEILTVEKWAAKHGDRVSQTLPGFAKRAFQSSLRMNTFHFAKDVLWVYSLIVLVTMLAVFIDFYLLFLAALHLYFLHVFTHIGQTLFLKQYTPGVATAIFPVLPYSLYAYYRLLSDQIVSSTDLLWGLGAMLILVPLGVILLLKGRDQNVNI